MSAALAPEALAIDPQGGATQAEAPPSDAEKLGEAVVELVRLAGGRVEIWAFEPVALLLVRAGVLDGTGLTFGSDYDLNVRSRELRRGFIEALGRGHLAATSVEMWLTDPALVAESANDERTQRARAVFTLPRAQLEQSARQHLLSE